MPICKGSDGLAAASAAPGGSSLRCGSASLVAVYRPLLARIEFEYIWKDENAQ
jgi:hypothetical protein